MRLQVPNDARAVITGTNSLSVVLVDPDVRYPPSVLLQRSLHHLCRLAYSPDPHFAFHAASHYSLAIVGWSQSSDSMVVSVVDGVKQLP